MTNINRKKIEFIGIGAAKSATSWIFRCLIEHPEVCGSRKKEIHFFNKIQNYRKGISYYLSFFKHCPENSIKGEFTPGYIFNPQVPKLIYKYFPDVKIIACLRNPVDRLYSLYRYHIKMGYEYSVYKSFESAISKEPKFVETGFYYRQLREYYKIFPKKNILILIYEDLLKNPIECLKKIFRFLNLHEVDFIPSLTNKKLNVTEHKIVKSKIPFIKTIIFKVRKLPKSFSLIQTLLHLIRFDRIINKILTINRVQIGVKKKKKEKDFHVLNENVRKHLKYTYREDIEKLEILIGLNLNLWK